MAISNVYVTSAGFEFRRQILKGLMKAIVPLHRLSPVRLEDKLQCKTFMLLLLLLLILYSLLYGDSTLTTLKYFHLIHG